MTYASGLILQQLASADDGVDDRGAPAPGGFRNIPPDQYQISFHDPQMMTTRAHGLAMYVVFDSPLQMVADRPEAYRNAAGFDFITTVPTSWDETRFIDGDIGEYVVLARRKGEDWYVGAMTNEAPRQIEGPLKFIGSNNYTMDLWQDGAEPSAVEHVQRDGITSDENVLLQLAPSGGTAMRLRPQHRP